MQYYTRPYPTIPAAFVQSWPWLNLLNPPWVISPFPLLLLTVAHCIDPSSGGSIDEAYADSRASNDTSNREAIHESGRPSPQGEQRISTAGRSSDAGTVDLEAL